MPSTEGRGAPLTPEQQGDLTRCRAGEGLFCGAVFATFHDKNPALATEAMRIWCGLGTQRACATLGRRIAKGLGVAADFDAGVDLMRAACTAEATACFELTLVLSSTRPDEAFEAARRGCGAGRVIQCAQAGDLALEGAGASTTAEAAAWYDTACEQGSRDGCASLLELSERGRPGPIDVAVLSERRRRACAVGVRSACGR